MCTQCNLECEEFTGVEENSTECGTCKRWTHINCVEGEFDEDMPFNCLHCLETIENQKKFWKTPIKTPRAKVRDVVPKNGKVKRLVSDIEQRQENTYKITRSISYCCLEPSSCETDAGVREK